MDDEKIFEEVKRLEENDEKKKNNFGQDFLKVLTLMKAISDENSKDEVMAKNLSHMMYVQYSAFINEGFTPEQAMELLKCIITGVTANNVLK